MASIEPMAQARTTQGERARAAQWRMACGARWVSSFRRDLCQPQASPRLEDVARSAVFFDSTCCWV